MDDRVFCNPTPFHAPHKDHISTQSSDHYIHKNQTLFLLGSRVKIKRFPINQTNYKLPNFAVRIKLSRNLNPF